jgi:hypothetical protein
MNPRGTISIFDSDYSFAISVARFKTYKLFVLVGIMWKVSIMLVSSSLLGTVLRYNHIIKWIFMGIFLFSFGVLCNRLLYEIIKFLILFLVNFESRSVTSLGSFLDNFELVRAVISCTFKFLVSWFFRFFNLSDLINTSENLILTRSSFKCFSCSLLKELVP